MSDVKRCTDCKHYVPAVGVGSNRRSAPAVCTHENNKSLEDGTPRETPAGLRYSMASTACGETGRWWEAKDERR